MLCPLSDLQQLLLFQDKLLHFVVQVQPLLEQPVLVSHSCCQPRLEVCQCVLVPFHLSRCPVLVLSITQINLLPPTSLSNFLPFTAIPIMTLDLILTINYVWMLLICVSIQPKRVEVRVLRGTQERESSTLNDFLFSWFFFSLTSFDFSWFLFLAKSEIKETENYHREEEHLPKNFLKGRIKVKPKKSSSRYVQNYFLPLLTHEWRVVEENERELGRKWERKSERNRRDREKCLRRQKTEQKECKSLTNIQTKENCVKTNINSVWQDTTKWNKIPQNCMCTLTVSALEMMALVCWWMFSPRWHSAKSWRVVHCRLWLPEAGCVVPSSDRPFHALACSNSGFPEINFRCEQVSSRSSVQKNQQQCGITEGSILPAWSIGCDGMIPK